MPKKPSLSLEATLMFHEFCQEMKSRGTRQVVVEFSGGGDEGSINDVLYTPPRKQTKEERAGWGFESEVEDMFDKIISEHDYDYSNGDGGCGSLVIDVDARTWLLNITFFETVYEEPENEDDEPREIEQLEIAGPTTKGGASMEDFKKILLSDNRADRTKAITLLPELFPDLRAHEQGQTKKPASKTASKAKVKAPAKRKGR